MNDLTRTPKTRTVTDAAGQSYVVTEMSEDKRRTLDRIIEEHGDALKRLADR